MNLQMHHLGQIPWQVSNQADTMVPGMPQQNGIPEKMQNPSIHRGVLIPDAKTRVYMRDKIFDLITEQFSRSQEVPTRTMNDIVEQFEDSLFKSATTMEEYLNLETLETRLHVLIKPLPMRNHRQQFSHVNSSPSMDTMIPTPGLQQAGNSSVAGTQPLHRSIVANNNTVASSTANCGSFFPTGSGFSGNMHGGSFGQSDGAFTSGYDQSSAFSINNYGRNNMVTSMGVQRMTSQMIPTPGFNNSNNNNEVIKNTNNNQTFRNMDMESSNSTSAHPAVMSSIVSQPMQRIRGQNSCILHNISGKMGGGMSNGSLNEGLGMMDGPGTTECYSGTIYGKSEPLDQQFDRHQRPVSHGNEYGIGADYASGPGDVNVPVSSVGSMLNKQSLNSIPVQNMAKMNSTLMINNQSNVNSTQQGTNMKPQLIDQSGKMNFHPQYSVRENLVQPRQHQQFQQSSHQFQHQEQLIQHGQQTQNHILLMNGSFGQSHSPNMVSDAKPGHDPVHRDEGLQTQVPDPFQFSAMQCQFQQNSMKDCSRDTQLLSHPSGPHDITSSLSQTSDQMQFIDNPQNDFCGQWYSKSQDACHVSMRIPHDQNIQDVFHHRLNGHDVAHPNNLSSEVSMISPSNASRSEKLPKGSNSVCRTNTNLDRSQQFWNQKKWLLFLRHARRCPAPEGKCYDPNCLNAQKLLKHMEHCNLFQCSYPRCCGTRVLINHHRRCHGTRCPVCVPVKNYVHHAHSKASDFDSGLPTSVNGSCKPYERSAKIGGKSTTPKTSPTEDLQPSIKRVKIAQGSQPIVSESKISVIMTSAVKGSPLHGAHNHDSRSPMKSGISDVKLKMEDLGSVGQLSSKMMEMKKDNLEDTDNQRLEDDPTAPNNPDGFGEREVINSEKEMRSAKAENFPLPSESISKSGKPKIKGVSLLELFTPEQIRQHITGLRQWVGQSKAKAEKNQAMEHSMSENSCQLCAVEKLNFEPPPTYCTPCGARIKRNAMYYTIGGGETRHYFCIPCYNEARGDTILVDGTPIAKARMKKKKNDEETEEWWVQCDKCEAWQHQICALFNGRRNDGGQAEYTCPNCYIEEFERGERVPLPQSAVLGAKDLPRTILSDHIEERLFAKLKQERLDRARVQGKSYDEVPGADSLVVRVVSSVDKKLEVKPHFLEIFQEENYPVEYPYKSKVILLFQKIEGVEVCLFGMYVQEFGSECQQPNHRRVYLSYLDSVKYFRPEIKAVTGEALRTFVYHEILIGYLEYCKLRGFSSCYIWACPPLKGEDYILYCHPEIQKTPKSDKLREWYLAMLRKAAKENIVSELTNLYDHFFVSTGECKSKVTAARLPYFDGDYWPGAAEEMIFQLQQEEDFRKQHKKVPLRKTIMKRVLKASGQSDLSGNASKDIRLMHKLGETISPMKGDFIIVHLQHACSYCCILMVSGNRWACNQCKNFHLCDKCYDAERRRKDRESHPIHHKDKHPLYPIKITVVPEDTKDKDEILESEFFDTRQAFLSLCQGNHYQYDTLRRAKHSSMMVLYHLHNPTAPAFVTTCNVCHLDIETGQGWRCETCPDYDVCNACYSKDGGTNHPHNLTINPSNDRNAQNKEARQFRVTQTRKMLELLVHASQCRTPRCQYPNCFKVKELFRHGLLCKVRSPGGCLLCKKMWHLLQLHSCGCKEPKCSVPRCRDLKEYMRRLQQQSDSRRRAAVMEMMRQRAAEVAHTS